MKRTAVEVDGLALKKEWKNPSHRTESYDIYLQIKKGRSLVDERPVGDRFETGYLTDPLFQVVDLEFKRNRASLPIFQKLRGSLPGLAVELPTQPH